MKEGWFIEERCFNPATAKAFEGLFTLGSGYLHVRGSLEEHLRDAPQNETYTRLPANVTSEKFRETRAKWGTYVPGIFGPHPLLNSEMINLPWFLGLELSVAGEKLDAEHSRIPAYRRTLDLETAVLRRELTWQTAAGPTISVIFERFVSGARPHLCLQRLTLRSDRSTEITIRGGIDADVRTNGYDHFRETRLSPTDPAGVRCMVQTDGGDEVFIETRLIGAADWRPEGESRRWALVGELCLHPDQPLLLEKRTAVSTSRDPAVLTPAHYLDEAAAASFDTLHAEHAEHWRNRWRSCDVRVEGDPESQLALRASLYHLLRAHVADDPRVAIDAKGFAGEAYWGRFFWDTEMYLLPFFLYTDPARARTLVDFRVQSLAGAKANAQRYGYAGARYAWESDAHGVECCPNWQYADHEVHVTADVAYGLAHYAAAAGGEEYLRGPAAAVLVETGRYWLERLDWRPGDPRPHLLGVMGPDEYTPISNDNSYTNRLVAFALHLAATHGEAAGATADEQRRFCGAAEGLPIPRHSDPTLVLQCEGFDLLAEPAFDRLWIDRTRTFAAQVSQERLYRSKCLKQADVLMLMALFPHEFTDEEVRRAWDYYLPYTTHDSSLSAGIHAIVAARLRLKDEAWRFWNASKMIDLDTAHGGAAEGIHIAGAAANWQVAIFGFAGVRTALQAQRLTIEPLLPDGWSRLAFPIRWKGQGAFVEITPDAVVITNHSSSPLEVTVFATPDSVPPASSRAWPSPAIRGVIFDLDGVLCATDESHYLAWKKLADEEGIAFDRRVNERLKGVGRMDSLDIILEKATRRYTPEEKAALAERKNDTYRQCLQAMTPADLLPGAEAVLHGLRQRGIKLAVGSSSRNAPLILERLGLGSFFDAVADGNDIRRSKPDPEVFLLAAERLGLRPRECLVVEDAAAGVEAARRAGMACFAVGEAAGLPTVRYRAASLAAIQIEELLAARL